MIVNLFFVYQQRPCKKGWTSIYSFEPPCEFVRPQIVRTYTRSARREISKEGWVVGLEGIMHGTTWGDVHTFVRGVM